MTKLNQKRIKWLVDQVIECSKRPKDIASVYGVTERRVQQLAKEFRKTKKYPELDKSRRPKIVLTDQQKKLIDEVYAHHRAGARILKIALDEDHPGNRISKNKIHEHLRANGHSKPDKKKQRPRKRCRYEREHSGSLVHSDTHFCKWNCSKKLMTVIDDASRRLLAAQEVSRITANNAIAVMKDAVAEAWKYRLLIKAVNTDRGSEFFANKEGKKQGRKHAYLAFLESKGIRHIPSRAKNPQTNGKLERWHQEYEKHRPSFSSLSEFVDWYNERIHGELRTRPNRAFRQKLPPECLVGLMFGDEDEKTK